MQRIEEPRLLIANSEKPNYGHWTSRHRAPDRSCGARNAPADAHMDAKTLATGHRSRGSTYAGRPDPRNPHRSRCCSTMRSSATGTCGESQYAERPPADIKRSFARILANVSARAVGVRSRRRVASSSSVAVANSRNIRQSRRDDRGVEAVRLYVAVQPEMLSFDEQALTFAQCGDHCRRVRGGDDQYDILQSREQRWSRSSPRASTTHGRRIWPR